MANGKCQMHGGKSTGKKSSQVGTKNPNTSHGIYSRFFTEEEKALEFKTGSVELELEIARVQLMRTLRAKQQWDNNADKTEDVYESGMDLVEVTREEGDRVVGEQIMPISSIKKVRKRPDFDGMIRSWTRTVESLEKTQRELMGTASGTPEDVARSILNEVDEMDSSVPEVVPDEDAS